MIKMSIGRWDGGKGSNPRPTDRKKFENNYDAIFGKKNKPSDDKAEPTDEKHNSVSKKPG